MSDANRPATCKSIRDAMSDDLIIRVTPAMMMKAGLKADQISKLKELAKVGE